MSEISRLWPERIVKQDLLARLRKRTSALRDSLAILKRPRRAMARTRTAYRWLQQRESRVLIVVACAGMVISAAGFAGVQHFYQNIEAQAFERQAAHYSQTVQGGIENYTGAVVETARPFGAAAGDVDRWEFFESAQARLPRYPGVRALIWAPRVPADKRESYEQNARIDGLFGFEFRERGADGAGTTVAPRAEYYPAYYIEPFGGNEALLGHDFASRPDFRAAMTAAAGTGRAIAVDPGDWEVLEGGHGLAIVLQPVFGGIDVASASAPERRRALTGFTVAVVDIAAVFQSTLEKFATPGWLDVFLCEEDKFGGGTRLLATYASPLRPAGQTPVVPAAHDDRAVTQTSIGFAGRELVMVVAAVPGYFRSGAGLMPWAAALIGLLLTAQLLQYLSAQRRREDDMRRTVTDRTERLTEAHELNEALRLEVQHRTEVEHQLRAAKTHAEIANRSKSEFLALISHELRTPLNAIIGFSEILSYEMFGAIGEPRYKGYAGDINGSAKHLLGVINSILDLTRVEGDQYQLNETDVDLADVIHGSARMLECRAKEAEVDIIVSCDRGLPFVFADDMALRQVFTNLLQNAIKFTPASGRIVVDARQDGNGRVVVAVTDNGIGIAAGDLDRVLQPFVQADSSLSRQYEGVGLGLPLCRKFAEMHGGVLELESEFGVGTTVRLVLPEDRALNVLRAVI